MNTHFSKLAAWMSIAALLLAACLGGPTAAPPTDAQPTQAPPTDAAGLPVSPVGDAGGVRGSYELAALLYRLDGKAEYRLAAEAAWASAAPGLPLLKGHELRTLADSLATLRINPTVLSRFGPETQAALTDLAGNREQPATQYALETGRIFVVILEPIENGGVSVKTALGTGSVAGSLMSLETLPGDRILITCLETSETCDFEHAGGTLKLYSGQQAVVGGQGQPVVQRIDALHLNLWFQNNPEALNLILVDSDQDGYSIFKGDCQNHNPVVHPAAADEPGDGLDANCDGADGAVLDADGDGFTAFQGDCDDADKTVNPAAADPAGDGRDQNCSGADGTLPDADLDGVVDSADACPQQPGALSRNGCPAPAQNRNQPGGGAGGSGAGGGSGPGAGGSVDADRDGWAATFDCDDANPARYPGAPDRPGDSVDSDCDGFDTPDVDSDGDGISDVADFCPAEPGADGCPDNDGDGYGSAFDCDDFTALIHPGAAEIPDNGDDENCDGVIEISTSDPAGDDDGDGVANAGDDCPRLPGPRSYSGCPNNDGDGYPVSDNPAFTDCNDNDARIYPGAPDAPGDGLDSDCDGHDDPAGDFDGDGFADNVDGCPATASASTTDGCPPRPDGTNVDADGDGVPANADCADGDPTRPHPNACAPAPSGGLAATCSLRLTDTGEIYPNVECHGYPPGTTIDACPIPGDPGAYDFCTAGGGAGGGSGGARGIGDTDNDGVPDAADDCPSTFSTAPDGCPDADNDGFTSGPRSGDCDDNNPNVRPGVPEVAGNGLDDNCNGQVDEVGSGVGGAGDADNDGVPDSTDHCPATPGHTSDGCPDADNDAYTTGPSSGDCNDGNPSIYPGAPEVAGNGLDDNCNGLVDEGLVDPNDVDDDGDGYTENGGDCDDGNSGIYQGAPEVVGNGIDDNCNGVTDEGGGSGSPDPLDVDDDGDGYTEYGGDCDDDNYAISPGGGEVPDDGIDWNCNGDDNT